MITFICCLATLIAGYFIYGSFIERIFGWALPVQPQLTPHQDGVDYIPMSSWKVFMIQFLNIAGLNCDLRCYYGRKVRYGFFPVDSPGDDLCRSCP